ncbi:MAG: CDP-alcohol phosphatidyltransferase family protein [bacterium]|nr:CDP-alcohol phosphatidyltransferase family protein [bacterium]
MGSLNKKGWFEQNSANLITSVRLVCSFCIIFLGINRPEMIVIMFCLILMATISDFLDGRIARSKKIVSTFGGFLDRLADKLFICSGIIIIIWRYWPINNLHPLAEIVTEGIGATLILLELILISSSIVGIIYKLSIASNKFGKIKMTLESAAVIFWFLALILNRYYWFDMELAIIIINVLLALAVFYAVKSLGGYYQRFTEGIKKAVDN